MNPMTSRDRARLNSFRAPPAPETSTLHPTSPTLFLATSALAGTLALVGCGGGSAPSASEGASADAAALAMEPPRDDAAEAAATRAALTAFLEDARMALQPAPDRASALAGGAGRGGGGRPGGGGGSSGDGGAGGGSTPTGGGGSTDAGGTPVTTPGGGGTPPVVLPVPVPGGPVINAARLLVAAVGLETLRIAPTNEVAPAAEGAFRVSCAPSHMGYDDPIVYPGQAGRSHLHTFFGNTGANAASTAESLRASGNSTCSGGIANRSAYWVPTMIDTRDGTPVVPTGIGVYYKNGYVDGSIVQPIPIGLRMIAGNASATGPTTTEFAYRFKCIGGPRNQNDLYGPTIGDCDGGAELWQEIFFPSCWDGRNLDSPDHKSHMSYNAWSTERGWHCPGSHPVAIPQITFNVIYGVPEAGAATRWRLASDAYSTSLPGGYSSHGDWFNGWMTDVSEAWGRRCVQARKDCHSHLLGDGRKIY
jgi:hypothetical protein